MNRSKLREETFKLLYSLEFCKDDIESIINSYIEEFCNICSSITIVISFLLFIITLVFAS